MDHGNALESHKCNDDDNSGDFVLQRHCLPPSSDLINSLVTSPQCGGASEFVLLLTTWQSNGFGVNVRQSLLDGRPCLTTELASRTIRGRITNAASWSFKEEEEDGLANCCWAFVMNGGKLIHGIIQQKAKTAEKDFSSVAFDVHVRYETRTVAVGRRKKSHSRQEVDGEHNLILITGGPRGVVVQTFEEKTKVMASLWRKHSIRLVHLSPDGEFLLICSESGDLGVWRTSALVTDDCPPVWASKIPSAAMCWACFSPAVSESDKSSSWFFLCVSTWASEKSPNGKAARPMHYIFKAMISGNQQEKQQIRIVAHKELELLTKDSQTTRVSALLPPPALCAFSSCGKFIATTSSCSSLAIWDLTTGTLKKKWTLANDPSSVTEMKDELCGIANTRLELGDLKSVLLVRTTNGQLTAIQWPIESGNTIMSRSCYLRRPISPGVGSLKDIAALGKALTAKHECFPCVQMVTIPSIEGLEDRVAMWAPNKSRPGCTVWIVGTATGNILKTFESNQPLGKDRSDDTNPWIALKLRFVSASIEGDGFVLKFDAADGPGSVYEVEKDIWRFT